MATFILIPGAGGAAWYWSRVAPLLTAADHEAIAVDLPADDPAAGLSAYADLVIAAIDGRRDAVLVAMSLGGFTAPIVAERAPLRGLVFVNAMIPVPGETAGAWWDNTGSEAARAEAARKGGYSRTSTSTHISCTTYRRRSRPKASNTSATRQPSPSTNRVRSARGRAYRSMSSPAATTGSSRSDFQRRVARERLGVDADVLPGGHLMALSNPEGLAEQLLRYL